MVNIRELVYIYIRVYGVNREDAILWRRRDRNA
jgi:hypothetical protein